MSPDKMSRTQCRGQNIMRTKCYWSKCRDILSTTFFRQHIFNGILSNHILSINITFSPRYFVRDILSGDILSGHPCRYTAAVRPTRQNGVRRISISEIQAMIACKNCVCLVGLRSVWYTWIAGGWIYSKPVRWLHGLFAGIGSLVGFMVGGWLAGWFVCYPVCWSVEPSGRLAISNLSPFDQSTIHPSI